MGAILAVFKGEKLSVLGVGEKISKFNSWG